MLSPTGQPPANYRSETLIHRTETAVSAIPFVEVTARWAVGQIFTAGLVIAKGTRVPPARGPWRLYTGQLSEPPWSCGRVDALSNDCVSSNDDQLE